MLSGEYFRRTRWSVCCGKSGFSALCLQLRLALGCGEGGRVQLQSGHGSFPHCGSPLASFPSPGAATLLVESLVFTLRVFSLEPIQGAFSLLTFPWFGPFYIQSAHIFPRGYIHLALPRPSDN